ncbi:rod shape-determining protein MreD [Bacillus sp. HMF5848]|uniref:rod shape-determining protein MreD n=1 Tax=Bacillus sp. HMF5848 TaxID=2495421 RepID=UPI000F78B523|nr:rod shape-determining protein MreD [Bacillus sp. HMF5848]RSK28013.1 rod shape-determining protein MreD [Bacillus sp. HMF5848]
MMKKLLLPCFFIVCFVLESIFVDLLPAQMFNIDRIFVPRFFLVTLLLTAVYYKRNVALLYGLGFGLLYDITYTQIIGIYMFGYVLLPYITSKIMRVVHSHSLIVLIIGIFIVALLEFYVYGINLLIGNGFLTFDYFIQIRLIPTLLINAVFIILVNIPLKRYFLHTFDLGKEK